MSAPQLRGCEGCSWDGVVVVSLVRSSHAAVVIIQLYLAMPLDNSLSKLSEMLRER